MKAFILRGSFRGKVGRVSQWCNDWFTLQDWTHQPFSPSALAFTAAGMKTIREHKNNGVLFEEFEEYKMLEPQGSYKFSFRKRKPLERRFITADEAWEIADQSEEESIHVFHNPGSAMLIGFDVSKDRVKAALENAESIEIGGDQCVGMGHGIVVIPKEITKHGDVWFIKHNKRKIKKYL